MTLDFSYIGKTVKRIDKSKTFPGIYLLKSFEVIKSEQVCGNCGLKNSKACSGCFREFYCSIKCQKNMWKIHKLCCGENKIYFDNPEQKKILSDYKDGYFNIKIILKDSDSKELEIITNGSDFNSQYLNNWIEFRYERSSLMDIEFMSKWIKIQSRMLTDQNYTAHSWYLDDPDGCKSEYDLDMEKLSQIKSFVSK